MKEQHSTGSPADVWAAIEVEKRIDRTIRRVCVAAWTFTLLLALVMVAAFTAPILQMWQGARDGAMPLMAVVTSAYPLFGALWTLSLLVASLSTVGVFLRLRTASLQEIQLRLAAIEEMVVRGGNARKESES
jgi:hypothetical protein